MSRTSAYLAHQGRRVCAPRVAEAQGDEHFRQLVAERARIDQRNRQTFGDVAALKEGIGADRFGRRFAGVAPLEPPVLGVRVTGALP